MQIKKTHIAGMVLTGLALIAQDVSADTWLDIHLSSEHIGSDGYWTWTELSSDEWTIPAGATHSTGPWYDRQFWRKDTYKWNEDNYGLGIDHSLNNHVSVIGGFYHGSFENWVQYAGFDIHTSRARSIQTGFAIGQLWGYEDTLTPMHWMFQPNVMVEVADFRLRVGWIPGSVIKAVTDEERLDVLTFSIGYKFR